MNYKERVGENIRYYRKLKDMTIKEVAVLCNLTEATMQKYETGQIKRFDIEMLHNIAEAIDATPEQLTGWRFEEDKEEAHKRRVEDREIKWINKYKNLSFDKQKYINKLIDLLSKDRIIPSEDDLLVLKMYSCLEEPSKSIVYSSLKTAYENSKQKKEPSFESINKVG